MVEEDVVYDSMNRIVWVSGQGSSKGKTNKQIYGKDYRKFSSNVQARAYAIRLAKSKGLHVYDKYYGEALKATPRKRPRQRRPFGWF